ncbi:MAG: Asp-tRNA(Asn)/Glu-tRNA(Gln) amidotransferase subunit GatC [bacterium]
MSEKLTTTQVQNIAKLARLELNEQEIEKFSVQLSSILDYFDQLKEVDTDNIEPTSQVMGLKNMTRDDLVDQVEIREELIACAPERDGKFVKVKNVL